MFNKCTEMEQEYTGNNNVTRHLNPPYLVSNLDELNILADSIGKQTWTHVHNQAHQFSSPTGTVLMQCVVPLLI